MDVKQYVESNRKVITTASGATFTIRKIPPTCMHIVFKLAQYAKPTGEIDPQYFTELAESLKELIPKVVVDPKITLEPVEGALAFDDLSISDVLDIFTQAFDFTGLGPQQAQREKFREDAIR